MPAFYLGLDCSTQSLTALLIDAQAARVIGECSIVFSSELPHWGTHEGVLPSDEPGVVHAPPLMWVEALDRLCSRMTALSWPVGDIQAIAGAAQQHGTVYLNNQIDSTLPMLDPDQDLHEQLRCCLARETAPVWMDSSTERQCVAITEALGGEDAVLNATGSCMTRRFSGPQIRRFMETDEAGWAATTHVCVVSSFLASIFAGEVVGIDHGDASGMNLLDLETRDWHSELVAITADDLDGKLSRPLNPDSVIGCIAPYFVLRHGFDPSCRVIPWTGDNPSSLIGLGLIEPGSCAISLGTSDTCFSLQRSLPTRPVPEGHLFIAPQGDYLHLLCFRNGSLARERMRTLLGAADWKAYADLVQATPPGNNGALLLPWFEPETVPRVDDNAVHRLHLDPDDAAANARALYESQMLALRHHLGERPALLRATGGASRDRCLLQIMADVFQVPVAVCHSPNSAALGAALRAWKACDDTVDWAAVVDDFTAPSTIIEPDPSNAALYDEALAAYAALEEHELSLRC